MIHRILLTIFLFLSSSPLFSEIIAKEGQGFLEYSEEKGYVLHLKGSPYEIGYQHGKLLGEKIARNIAEFIDASRKESNENSQEFLRQVSSIKTFIPEHLNEEMKGLAEGAGIPLEKIVMLNLFPEMFHCSGITVQGKASLDQELYQVRVLDYSIGKNLQNSAVVMVVEPDNKIPFLNVSYAGFIGSVTGMNTKKISIGEIGGHGYGYWKGVPMAFLIREMLENTTSIAEAQEFLKHSARTCEYYYIISDGKTNESVGAYATSSQIHFLHPSENYAILAPASPPLHYGPDGDNDKFFLGNCRIENSSHQSILFDEHGKLSSIARNQPEDCLLMTGFSNPERYVSLVDRMLGNYGNIEQTALMEIVKAPVSAESNLHNAIFHPASLKIWIAHAGPHNEPAYTQPYVELSLTELLETSSE